VTQTAFFYNMGVSIFPGVSPYGKFKMKKYSKYNEPCLGRVAVNAGGNLLASSVRSDSLWLIALVGTMEESAPDVADAGFISDSSNEFAMATGATNLENGRIVFQSICSACHGFDGKGGHGGGASLVNSHDSGAIVDIIIHGGEQMPPLASAFTPEQLRDVAA
jgi:mono/diheme cytochrome c family protein